MVSALTPPSPEEAQEEQKKDEEEDAKVVENAENGDNADMPDQKETDVLNSGDYPILGTEDGKYLASVLGDVLIKGLTDVSSHRPEDPIGHLAQWLYEYASGSAPRERKDSQVNIFKCK